MMARFFQRPRTRCLIATVIVGCISVVLIYHGLLTKHRSTTLPPEYVLTVAPNDVDDQPQEHHQQSDDLEEPKKQIPMPCNPVPPLKNVDISTPEVYPTLNFKPPYRSYWNYTYEKRYLKRKESWDKLPLKVIVIPHSHNDPGWLKTFDGYFMAFTAHILNNMVDKLIRYKDMTFVWSEMSFFSRWWNGLKNRPQMRDQVRRLLHNGQLELITGGWVMTDEAAAHYYGMIDQLVEGHQWMWNNLGIVPRSAWSVDSFGHSGTVPYLLRASGLHNMVIQRTHYAWKAYLAERTQLNFWWRQEFDSTPRHNNSGDVLCQMMPFDLYSIKHSCGPDPDICLQFDFRRIAGEYSESRAWPITPEKLPERADLLLGQYGRIGSLFPHNVALIPLGDDFRYNHDVEWDQQYENYAKLMEYINSRTDWHAEVKFGTLKDYFNEVHKRMNILGYQSIPTLVGDFHAYGDIYGEGRPSYWTGYFTSRPYWKHMCRDLQHWLRSAEILYSFGRAYVQQRGLSHLAKRLDQDYAYLSVARDSLGLFQHHDAITGTSKEAVMVDYGMRLFRGVRETMGIVAHSALFIMAEDAIRRSVDLRPANPLASYLYPDIEQANFDKLPEKIPLSVSSEGRQIVLYNSKAHRSVEPVRVKVRSAFVKVLDPDGEEVPIQVNPAWNGSVQVLGDVYEVLFIARLPPLSLSTFVLMPSETSPRPKTQVSISLNDAFAKQPRNSIFSFQTPTDTDIEVSSPSLRVRFSKQTGLLETMERTDLGIINRVRMVYQAYRSEEFRSGAYLFHPVSSEPVQNVSGRFPVIRIVRGPICSELTAIYSNVVSATYRIYHIEGSLGASLEMDTVFDIAQIPDVNLELFLRVQTDIDSGDTFYTDSNGFQMVKRHTLSYLPLEANFYPATSAAYIEDTRSRLSLLMSHAHGVASVNSGWLEAMLDRRLRSDDNRGLGEGVLDNKRTLARFWLVLEAIKESFSEEVPNLSAYAHGISSLISDPVIVVASNGAEKRNLKSRIEFLSFGFPCNIALLNLRSIPRKSDFDSPSNRSLAIVHNKGGSCRTKSFVDDLCVSQKMDVLSLEFQNVRVSTMFRTLLTGVSGIGGRHNSSFAIQVKPMDISSHVISFADNA